MSENNSHPGSLRRSIKERFFALREPDLLAHVSLICVVLLFFSFAVLWAPMMCTLLFGVALSVTIVDLMVLKKVRKRRRELRRPDAKTESEKRSYTLEELIKPALIALGVILVAVLIVITVALNIGAIFGALGHMISPYGLTPWYALQFFVVGIVLGLVAFPAYLKPVIVPTAPRVNVRQPVDPTAANGAPRHASSDQGSRIQIHPQNTGSVGPTQVQPRVDASGYPVPTLNGLPVNSGQPQQPVTNPAGYPTQQATAPVQQTQPRTQAQQNTGNQHGTTVPSWAPVRHREENPQGWSEEPAGPYHPQQWTNHPEIPAIPNDRIPTGAQSTYPTIDPNLDPDLIGVDTDTNLGPVTPSHAWTPQPPAEVQSPQPPAGGDPYQAGSQEGEVRTSRSGHEMPTRRDQG